MKGPLGLIMAALLGVLAMVLNFIYLTNKAAEFPSLEFLAVKKGVTIRAGQAIKESDLVSVKIPIQNNARDLQETVYLHKDKPTVVGILAARRYVEGDLIMRRDYVTPAIDFRELSDSQGVIFLPLGNLSLETGLVNPGDKVTFVVTPRQRAAVSPDVIDAAPQAGDQRPQGIISGGTFVVASMGTRLGDKDVPTKGRSNTRARSMGIVVTMHPGGLPDPQAQKLLGYLADGQYQVSVVLQRAKASS